MNDVDIDELLRLEAEATPGPWEWARFTSPEGDEDGVHCPKAETAHVKPDGTWHALTVCRGMTGPRRSENAQFISAVRNHLKPLIQRLKRVEAERDALKAAVDSPLAFGDRVRVRSSAGGSMVFLSMDYDHMLNSEDGTFEPAAMCATGYSDGHAHVFPYYAGDLERAQ